MKLAVLAFEPKKSRSISSRTHIWRLIELKEGTEKDIEVWEDGDVTYYTIPFWPVENEQTGYVWDKFDSDGRPIGRIKNGRFVRWLDYYEGIDVFESLWGNIF